MLSAATLPPAGVDIVTHNLRVDLDIGADGIAEETLVFLGRMVIERGDPFTNGDGFRQINFTVLDWTATAFSQVLNTEIDYVRSPIDQPLSTIISEQMGSDFPVRFKFNLIFDVFAAGNLVFSHHPGMPNGGGFMTVPPDANSPTITQFEDPRISIVHPDLGLILFTPIDCHDTGSTTVPEAGTFLLLGLGTVASIAVRWRIQLVN